MLPGVAFSAYLLVLLCCFQDEVGPPSSAVLAKEYPARLDGSNLMVDPSCEIGSPASSWTPLPGSSGIKCGKSNVIGLDGSHVFVAASTNIGMEGSFREFDLSSFSMEIDAAEVVYLVSGLFGSKRPGTKDWMELHVYFLDVNNKTLSNDFHVPRDSSRYSPSNLNISLGIGAVGNRAVAGTRAEGCVPAGTVRARVELRSHMVWGVTADGNADSLQLKLWHVNSTVRATALARLQMATGGGPGLVEGEDLSWNQNLVFDPTVELLEPWLRACHPRSWKQSAHKNGAPAHVNGPSSTYGGHVSGNRIEGGRGILPGPFSMSQVVNVTSIIREGLLAKMAAADSLETLRQISLSIYPFSLQAAGNFYGDLVDEAFLSFQFYSSPDCGDDELLYSVPGTVGHVKDSTVTRKWLADSTDGRNPESAGVPIQVFDFYNQSDGTSSSRNAFTNLAELLSWVKATEFHLKITANFKISKYMYCNGAITNMSVWFSKYTHTVSKSHYFPWNENLFPYPGCDHPAAVNGWINSIGEVGCITTFSQFHAKKTLLREASAHYDLDLLENCKGADDEACRQEVMELIDSGKVAYLAKATHRSWQSDLDWASLAFSFLDAEKRQFGPKRTLIDEVTNAKISDYITDALHGCLLPSTRFVRFFYNAKRVSGSAHSTWIINFHFEMRKSVNDNHLPQFQFRYRIGEDLLTTGNVLLNPNADEAEEVEHACTLPQAWYQISGSPRRLHVNATPFGGLSRTAENFGAPRNYTTPQFAFSGYIQVTDGPVPRMIQTIDLRQQIDGAGLLRNGRNSFVEKNVSFRGDFGGSDENDRALVKLTFFDEDWIPPPLRNDSDLNQLSEQRLVQPLKSQETLPAGIDDRAGTEERRISNFPVPWNARYLVVDLQFHRGADRSGQPYSSVWNNAFVDTMELVFIANKSDIPTWTETRHSSSLEPDLSSTLSIKEVQKEEDQHSSSSSSLSSAIPISTLPKTSMMSDAMSHSSSSRLVMDDGSTERHHSSASEQNVNIESRISSSSSSDNTQVVKSRGTSRSDSEDEINSLQSPEDVRVEEKATLLGDEVLVTADVTVTVSAAVSSFVSSPAAASRGARIGSVSRMIQCAHHDGVEEVDEPDLLAYLSFGLKFNFLAGATSSSSSAQALASHATGILITVAAILVCCLLVGGATFFIHRKGTTSEGGGPASSLTEDKGRTRKKDIILWISNAALSMLIAFFGPTIAEGCTTVLSVAAATTSQKVVAGVGLSLILVGTAVLLVLSQPAVLKRYVSFTETRDPVSATEKVEIRSVKDAIPVECFLPYFDAVRRTGQSGSLMTALVPMYFLEELLVSVLIGVLAGIKPGESGSCTILGGLILALLVLHALFVVVIRPYLRRLDTAFCLVLAFGQLVQGILIMIIIKNILDDNNHSGTGTSTAERSAEESALEILELTLGVAFFVQLVVQLFWVYTVKQRKGYFSRNTVKHIELSDDAADTASTSSLHPYDDGQNDNNMQSSGGDDILGSKNNNEKKGLLSQPLLLGQDSNGDDKKSHQTSNPLRQNPIQF